MKHIRIAGMIALICMLSFSCKKYLDYKPQGAVWRLILSNNLLNT